MQKKFFFVFVTALVGVSLFLAGCSTEAEDPVTIVKEQEPRYDVTVGTEADLLDALARPGNLKIGVTTTPTLTAPLVIPAGKQVYLLNGTKLDPVTDSQPVTVEGELYVGYGGELKASATYKVSVTTGKVYVSRGGKLSVDAAGGVIGGGEGGLETALGTGKVSITEGTLALSTALTAISEAKTALAYLSSGTLVVTSSAIVPSAVTAAAVEGVSASKLLDITTSAAEAGSGAIIIPSWVKLTANTADFSTFTGLTVNANGELSSTSATLAALTDLTVNGELTLGNDVNVTTALATAKVSGTGELTLGTTDFSAAKYAALLNIKNVTSAATTLSAAFTVPAEKTLTLTGAAAPADNVTVNGTVVVDSTGSLAVTASKQITVGANGSVTAGLIALGAGT